MTTICPCLCRSLALSIRLQTACQLTSDLFICPSRTRATLFRLAWSSPEWMTIFLDLANSATSETCFGKTCQVHSVLRQFVAECFCVARFGECQNIPRSNAEIRSEIQAWRVIPSSSSKRWPVISLSENESNWAGPADDEREKLKTCTNLAVDGRVQDVEKARWLLWSLRCWVTRCTAPPWDRGYECNRESR